MLTYNYSLSESRFTTGGFKNWAQYTPSSTMSEDWIDVGKGVFCPMDYEEDSRPNGWYYKSFRYRHVIEILQDTGSDYSSSLGSIAVGLMFPDQFLVIDGRRIDFSSLHNLKMDFNLSEQPFSEPGKKGKIAKLGMDISYLGKNFHAEHLDSIYVEK